MCWTLGTSFVFSESLRCFLQELKGKNEIFQEENIIVILLQMEWELLLGAEVEGGDSCWFLGYFLLLVVHNDWFMYITTWGNLSIYLWLRASGTFPLEWEVLLEQVCSLVWLTSLNVCFVIVCQIIFLVFNYSCFNNLPLCFQGK